MALLEVCSNCKFAMFHREEAAGSCRRYPPQCSVSAGNHGRSDFPSTFRHEWCGEFKVNNDIVISEDANK